jgi:GNAT superfamily N-acetyltransferase
VAPPGSGVTYRRYRGPEDLAGMAEANQRLRTRCGQLEPVDLEAMQHRYTHLVNSDPLVDCVVAERGGRIVGYTRTEWHDLTDGDRVYDATVLVEPDAWGLGVTDAFLDWSEARLRETARTLPDDRRAWLATGIFDGHDELAASLAARGYHQMRWDAEMVRPTMDDLPDVPPLPEGYAIRPVRLEDMPAVSAMVVEAFREHWGETEASGDELSEWIESPRFDIELISVVWHGDEPAACVSMQVHDHADGGVIAYVDGVSTHPAHRRRGLAARPGPTADGASRTGGGRVRSSASTPTIRTRPTPCTRMPASGRCPAARRGGSRSPWRNPSHEHRRVAAGHRSPVRARRRRPRHPPRARR